MLDQQHAARLLAQNAARIAALLQETPAIQARWRPDPESWSILEVATHLRDEEREDFRVRLDIILYHPQDPWPPIDPGGWVTARRYNDGDLDRVATDFQEERARSLGWLRGLAAPDWAAMYEAPWGPIRAGDLLASWVAHDLLHLRQLVELQWAYTQLLAAPFGTRYAGEW
jgi:hypothetical protein